MVRPVNCALIGLVFVKQKAPFAGHLRHHGRFYILKHFLQKASTILPNVDGNRGAIVFFQSCIYPTHFCTMLLYHDPFPVQFYGSQY